MLKRIFFLIAAFLFLSQDAFAQLNIGGDFRARWLHDTFRNAEDERPDLNYLRYLGRINASARVMDRTSFHGEFTTFTLPNPLSPARNVVGTGDMSYGISQLYGETVFTEVPFIEATRMRVGRQPFPIGSGLSQGDSAYFINNFDGVRLDLSFWRLRLSMMSAITDKDISSGGYFPEPGGDMIHIGRLATDIGDQNIMGYFIYNRLDGIYNDNYIAGVGGRGTIIDEMDYYWEAAHQTYNVAPGLPEMSGFGTMSSLRYRWQMGPLRWFLLEGRHAAYQGNNPDTDRVERFSPLYPSFFWGDRSGFVNPVIGGDWPRNGRQRPHGSHMFYGRMYVVPNVLPQLRIQLQYIHAREFVDHDNYNPYDDEFSLRMYYTVSTNNRFQLRYVRVMPNEDDYRDRVTSLLDRYTRNRVMLEWRVRF